MTEKTENIYASRREQLGDLNHFIIRKRERLYDIVKKIGWSEYALHNKKKVPCSVNPGHWIDQATAEKHASLCALLNEGYLREDLEKCPPCSHFFYTNSTSTVPVLIGKEQLEEIVSTANGETNTGTERQIRHMPQTMDCHIAEFTPQERLAIYDYVVEKGKATNKPKNLKVEDLVFDLQSTKDQDEEKPKTHLEILAAQRDYKRRRQSYRAKKVHITKKSYTEVIREVIENHSVLLSDPVDDESQNGLHPADDYEAHVSDEESGILDNNLKNRSSQRLKDHDVDGKKYQHDDDGKKYHRNHTFKRQWSRSASPEYRTHRRSRERFDYRDYDYKSSSHSSSRKRSRSRSSHSRKHKHKKHKSSRD